ncbi:MAG: heavy metal translocating P-type ATPase [Archangium sp.]
MSCLHCASPIPVDAEDARFCCRGCATVYELLKTEGLDRYYALAGNQVTPVSGDDEPRSHAWLEAMLTPGVCSLELDVQGIHCAACVWLMNETFRRRATHGEVLVNPALGSVRLDWQPGSFDVHAWVEEVERFGYRFGPRLKTAGRSELPLRLGISVALTINVMLFSVSFYFGLAPGDGAFELFSWLALALSTLTVLVGGWPFFRSAIQGVRSGVLHLDLPIALGITLVFATSLVQFVMTGGRGDAAYFDTLNTFISLMLLGRFLQERVLERNRRFLLEDGGAEGLLVRRETLELVPASKVRAGDRLRIAAGELIPVAARLLDDASIRTDWMTGEPEPRRVRAGDSVLAGSFNPGGQSFLVEATEDFAQSRLVELLRSPPAKQGTSHLKWWDALARRWVVTVLAVSALGLIIWLPRGIDDALRVTVSLLVITCPCAIGLALPLAYELTKSRLRRRGFYARLPDVLDRAVEVRNVVFDKTGTLTLGRLEWVNRRELSPEVRDVAWNLAARSSHPVSMTLAAALKRMGANYDEAVKVTEVAGQGVEWNGWKLGKAEMPPLHRGGEGWGEAAAHAGVQAHPGALPDGERGTSLTLNGETIATFEFADVPRPGTRELIDRLKSRGYQLWLLSGDAQSRVTRLAESLGLDPRRALGDCSPEEKSKRLTELGADHLLYLGDGVNDSLAFDRALLAGTPAIERPVMPARSDFFLVGQNLEPLCDALDAAHRLRRVVRRVLTLSVAYNGLAITASLLGLMSPLAAAVSMPASTLTLLFVTVRSLQSPPSTVQTPPSVFPHLRASANASTPSTYADSWL